MGTNAVVGDVPHGACSIVQSGREASMGTPWTQTANPATVSRPPRRKVWRACSFISSDGDVLNYGIICGVRARSPGRKERKRDNELYFKY